MAEKTVSDTLDSLDTLQQKLAQLDAMLAMSYGSAGETFRNMNDSLQDNYLWACSAIAGECRELADGLSLARFEGETFRAEKLETEDA